MRRCGGALALAALACVLAACEHSAPGGVTSAGNVGPFSVSLPRRLTFFEGDDITPSVRGGTLVFSRQSASEPSNYDPTGRGREACFAFMDVEGGTIARQLCPDRLVTRPDTFVDTWSEPAVSPDGRRIAFFWKRGTRIGPLAFHDGFLAVTSVDRPTEPPAARVQVTFLEAGATPRRANIPTRVTWADDGHVRFLATVEHIIKVKDGGAERVTDTLEYPIALMELDVAAGTAHVVPGGDSVLAYAAAPDGGIWVVRADDSTALWRLDPATGSRTLVGRFASTPLDVATVGGIVVAIVDEGNALAGMDPETGIALPLFVLQSLFPLKAEGPARRLAPAGGRRFVIAIDHGVGPFGAPPDLWLMELW